MTICNLLQNQLPQCSSRDMMYTVLCRSEIRLIKSFECQIDLVSNFRGLHEICDSHCDLVVHVWFCQFSA